jgi:hypothetical protein
MTVLFMKMIEDDMVIVVRLAGSPGSEPTAAPSCCGLSPGNLRGDNSQNPQVDIKYLGLDKCDLFRVSLFFLMEPCRPV